MAERARLAGALASLALLAPLTVLATAAPVAAERAVLADPAGDVVRTTITEDEEMDSVYDTADTGTDVRRLVVRHAARKLTLTVHVRDLVRGVRGRSASFAVETAGSWMMMARVDVGRTPARDRATTIGWMPDEPRKCRGITHVVSAQDDTIAVTIPRRCLGNPRWVRVSASVLKSPRGSGASGFTPAPRRSEPGYSFSQDDAGSDGRRPFAMPRTTRRVHVG